MNLIIALAAGLIGIVILAIVLKIAQQNRAAKERKLYGEKIQLAAERENERRSKPGHAPIKKRRMNSKGWVAPDGYYFDDEEALFDADGSLIEDVFMVATLCGQQHADQIVSPEPVADIDPEPIIPPVSPTRVEPESSRENLLDDRLSGGYGTGDYDTGGDYGGGDGDYGGDDGGD